MSKEISQSSAKAYIGAGIALLFLGSFLDNLRGPLLPILTRDLSLGYESSSLLFVVGNAISILITFLLIPVMTKVSERRTCLLAVAISILACAFSPWVSGFRTFVSFALLLGIATGSIGAMCNIMTMIGTRPSNQRQVLSILHMTYGVGALAAPILLVKMIDFGFSWDAAFLFLLLPLLVLFYFVSARIPEVGPIAPTSGASFIFSRNQVIPLMIFGLYGVGEVMTSSWLVTYLVEGEHQTLQHAAGQLSLFFLVMATSRFANLFLRTRRGETVALVASLAIPLVAHVYGRVAHASWILPVTGVVGSFFPLFLSRLKDQFFDRWREMTVWIVVVLQILNGLGHYVTGRVTELWGIGVAFYLPPVSLGLCIVLYLVYLQREKSKA